MLERLTNGENTNCYYKLRSQMKIAWNKDGL